MNNRKSKKLRGLKRKVISGFFNLRKQLSEIDKKVIVGKGTISLLHEEGYEILNDGNLDFTWQLQDPQKSIRTLLINTNEQTNKQNNGNPN